MGRDIGDHGEHHKFVAVDVPDFIGAWELLFVSDQVSIVELVGFKCDVYGHPVYLVDDTGRFYNFNTIISFKKVTDG